MNEIASRYGLALFELAKENDNVVSMQKEAKELRAIFNDNPDFIMVLGSHFLSIEEREEIVDQTLIGFDEAIISLIKVMIKNRRTNLMDNVLQAFNSYCNEYRGVDEGLIYSTIPLDEKLKKEIEKSISKKEHRDVELISRIDPTLIGGVKVVIGGRIYDGSIKNQIESMKTKLLQRRADYEDKG